MEGILRRLIRRLQTEISKICTPEKKRKVIHTQINGYELLVLANEDVGRQIHYLGAYEKVETDYLVKNINPSAVCIDIGANIGYFTMLMAQTANTGSVHAFEPILLNAELLRVSVELNGFTNVHINQFAVGNVEGQVSFSQSADSAYSSMIDTDRKPLERVLSVPITTLDSYLEHNKIYQVDVLKVDVEGAEELVVLGATVLLSDKKRRPEIILMELYNENLQAFGSSLESIKEKLQSFGYQAFVINERGHVLPFIDKMKSDFYNILFLSDRFDDQKSQGT